MVYLGMGARACKISRPLDAGFILFQFWVGLISVVPVKTQSIEDGIRSNLSRGFATEFNRREWTGWSNGNGDQDV